MALTPGERIDLKKDIAATLGQQDWRDVDLTLEEFGFPVSDEWGGDDREGYVLAMLRTVNKDAPLIQLHSYLHPRAVEAAPPQPEAFDDPTNPWSGSGLRLFLSHVNASAEAAGALRSELAKRSVDAFVAHDAIEPTEDWKKIILYALRSCDACLALLSPGFRESKWYDQEVGYCMARGRLVIPVEFGVTPYGFLGDYQALPVKKGHGEVEISLAVFELLVRKPQSRGAMARALVQRWAETDSWENARENYSFLKKVPAEAWTQQLATEVWEARDRVYHLKTANLDWKDSDKAVQELFEGLPYDRPSSGVDDDLPF